MGEGRVGGTVAVVGQGYVGLPLAIRAAESGWRVVAFDVDTDRVASLAAGRSPIEDVSDPELGDALADGRYRPTSDPVDLVGFDVAVVCVPTPLCNGVPDLSCVEQACRTVARYLRSGAVVILESTTYPGTCQELVAPLFEEVTGLRAGHDFCLGYSPERIDPGNTKWTFANTPKVVSGVADCCLARVRSFYDQLVMETVAVTSPAEAELVKLLENTFRHVNIALVNEFARFASDAGIDMRQVVEAAATKPYGFMSFKPGPGVGGHCLPVDPTYLAWRCRALLGRSFRFVDLANDVNNAMPEHVVQRLVAALNDRGMALRGLRVLLLGMAYKPNTADDRESPSRAVAERLVAMGADVRCADPHVPPERLPAGCVAATATAVEAAAAEAVVLLVDHQAFDLGAITSSARYVLDCRYATSGAVVESL